MDARDMTALTKLADKWDGIAEMTRRLYLGRTDAQASTAITVLESCAMGLRDVLEVLGNGA